MKGHVLVVGAGGIGCPALIGLDHAGVERVTVIDLDVVERSNLPRQILFDDRDVGAAKAIVAASKFEDHVTGIHGRFDDESFHDHAHDVDVIVDATDGARTKDWLNHAAVHARVPLVHAAGLRSEARLLVVPPGGGPCLACLFGRLTEESASCADLGVWNGVVGTIGFLAAAAATRVLQRDLPPPRYEVFDFDAKRTMSLEATISDTCPVCAQRPAGLEPFPDAASCEVPESTASGIAADQVIDLRDVRCPMNLLRARQALRDADPGQVLEFQLGEEGAATVPDGVRLLGHEIVHDAALGGGRVLRVRAVETATKDHAFSADALERYARQLVLPDLGPSGQRRLGEATVTLTRGEAPTRTAFQVAQRYLKASGVGRVETRGRATLSATVGAVTWRVVRDRDGLRVTTEGDGVDPGLAGAALLADRVQRYLVDPNDTRPSFALRA